MEPVIEGEAKEMIKLVIECYSGRTNREGMKELIRRLREDEQKEKQESSSVGKSGKDIPVKQQD